MNQTIEVECENEFKMMQEKQGRKQSQREKNFKACLEKRKNDAIAVKVRNYFHSYFQINLGKNSTNPGSLIFC